MYRRGRVLYNPLQGYHLLKATGETAGCWQETQLVERQEIVVTAMPYNLQLPNFSTAAGDKFIEACSIPD